MKNILKEIEKNPGKYAVSVGFKSDWGNMYKNHAYELKEIITDKNGKKFVILVNPWDSSKNIKVPYEHFLANVADLDIVEPPDARPNKNLTTRYDRLQECQDYVNIYNNFLKQSASNKSVDKQTLKKLVSKTNSNTIKVAFTSKKDIMNMIKLLDYAEWGWGHGETKKALIKPFVDAYCEYAGKCGVDNKTINEVRTACYDELDATFYTNEDTIIENLQKLFDKISQTRGGSSNITKKFGL